jgi:gliding motility-associated lipoprotein GldH
LIRILFIGACISIVLSSCKNDVIAKADFELPDNQWLAGDIKTMTFDAPDTTQGYQLELKVNHSDDYLFQNLYVRTTTSFPSGKDVVSITSLELANADGTWAGDCSGKKCSITLPLQTGFEFPEVGTYKWQIEPYMRSDTTTGIRSIEVLFKKTHE